MKALWMPEGSVRAIIALIVIGVVCALAFKVVMMLPSEALADVALSLVGGLMTLVGVMGTFYYVTRMNGGQNGGGGGGPPD